MARVNPGRIAAVRALIDVERGGFADDSLLPYLPKAPRDRGLARHLCFGVLRRRGEVDGALRLVLKQPLQALEPPVRAILRVGAFEKLLSRTREHAVVHQTVELCRPLKAGRAKGLVNAVMRRVKPNEALTRSERLNHPEWLVERWEERYGAEATGQWCQENNEPPSLFIVGKVGYEPEALRAAGLEVNPVELGGGVLQQVWRLSGQGGAVSDLPGFAEGHFWVQDAAAVLMVDLLGEVKGKRVLDACAAPGGKSFRLASRGANVLCSDISPKRLNRVKESAVRLDCPLETVAHDWEQGALDVEDPFDAVLVDAPCSGIGVIRRRPEIRWRRQEADLAASALRQEKILSHCSTRVRPGGNLVYTVCSPAPEEGRGLIERFLGAHPDFVLERTLDTSPPSVGEDAHFGALLTRK
jgi:16S rRNA (cytosine967-C5)-methyltransferase